MPFTTRNFTARENLGFKECVEHDLVLPYPVMSENRRNQIATVKFTALVDAHGAIRLTSHPPSYVHSDKQLVDSALSSLLSHPVRDEGPTEALPVALAMEDANVAPMEN